MFNYSLRRLGWGIVTIIGAMTLIFVTIRVIPGDPAAVILEERFSGEEYVRLKHELGLDQPIHVQYFRYLRDLATGNLGVSFHTNENVLIGVLQQFKYTFQLALAGMLISVICGIPLGIAAALHQNKLTDQICMFFALIGMCIPSFWFGLLMILVFAFGMGWFPVIGAGNPGQPLDMVWHLILPALTVGLRSMALNARVTRSTMLEIINQDYIRVARAKGLQERVVIYKHGLRNALIPIVTVVGLDLGRMLGGTTITEIVFNRPGIGHLLVNSVLSRDYPYIQATLFLYVILVVICNLMVDLTYKLIDPRIRQG